MSLMNFVSLRAETMTETHRDICLDTLQGGNPPNPTKQLQTSQSRGADPPEGRWRSPQSSKTTGPQTQPKTRPQKNVTPAATCNVTIPTRTSRKTGCEVNKRPAGRELDDTDHRHEEGFDARGEEREGGGTDTTNASGVDGSGGG